MPIRRRHSKRQAHALQEKDRPLMFICHSMGGIIVKQVRFYTIKRPPNKTDILVGTRESTSQEEPDSKRNQMHCIYGNASQRLDAGTVISLSKLGSSKTKAAAELKTFSSTLKDINDEFIVFGSKYRILSCIETKGIPPWGLVCRSSNLYPNDLLIKSR